LKALIAEKERVINALRKQLAESERSTRADLRHNESLSERSKSSDPAKEKDAIIAELSVKVSEQQIAVDAMQTRLARKELENQVLTRELKERNAELQKINASRGWRLLKRYGQFKYRYLLPVYKVLGLPPYNKKGEASADEKSLSVPTPNHEVEFYGTQDKH